MAIVAVALSSAVMIIALATVSGFQNGIKEKIIGINGHIVIDDISNTEGAVPVPMDANKEKLGEKIKSVAGVSSVSTCAMRPCIIRADEEIDGMVAKGVDKDYNFDFLQANLIAGKIPDFNKDTNQVLISDATAKRLNLKIGEHLQVIFLKDEIEGLQNARAIVPVICGIFSTGLEDFDRSLIVTYRGLIRKMLPKSTTFTQWELKLSDFTKAPAVSDAIANQLPAGTFNINTVQRYNRQIFDWLSLLDTNVVIILGLMILVACINMCTTLLILITERTQMVGVLKAMGAGNAKLRQIFIYQAMFIAFVGLFIGNFIGISFCLIQQKYQLIKLPMETYYVNHVLIDIEPWHLPVVNIGTLLICFIVLFLPAMVISRLTPVKTMRFQ